MTRTCVYSEMVNMSSIPRLVTAMEDTSGKHVKLKLGSEYREY